MFFLTSFFGSLSIYLGRAISHLPATWKCKIERLQYIKDLKVIYMTGDFLAS